MGHCPFCLSDGLARAVLCWIRGGNDPSFLDGLIMDLCLRRNDQVLPGQVWSANFIWLRLARWCSDLFRDFPILFCLLWVRFIFVGFISYNCCLTYIIQVCYLLYFTLYSLSFSHFEPLPGPLGKALQYRLL